VSTNDTLANSIANNGLGARTKDETAITIEGMIVSQGEDAEQSRIASGGAGQHTTGASEPPGVMSPGDINTWTRALKSFKSRALEKPSYRAGKGQAKVRILHQRWARWMQLRLSQHQSQRDAKGRHQIRRDGAWVRREQSLCSWDPPAHFQQAPTWRYSGYQQPFPSRAGSQNAHTMLLGRKSPTVVPHWKGRSI